MHFIGDAPLFSAIRSLEEWNAAVATHSGRFDASSLTAALHTISTMPLGATPLPQTTISHLDAMFRMCQAMAPDLTPPQISSMLLSIAKLIQVVPQLLDNKQAMQQLLHDIMVAALPKVHHMTPNSLKWQLQALRKLAKVTRNRDLEAGTLSHIARACVASPAALSPSDLAHIAVAAVGLKLMNKSTQELMDVLEVGFLRHEQELSGPDTERFVEAFLACSKAHTPAWHRIASLVTVPGRLRLKVKLAALEELHARNMLSQEMVDAAAADICTLGVMAGKGWWRFPNNVSFPVKLLVQHRSEAADLALATICRSWSASIAGSGAWEGSSLVAFQNLWELWQSKAVPEDVLNELLTAVAPAAAAELRTTTNFSTVARIWRLFGHQGRIELLPSIADDAVRCLQLWRDAQPAAIQKRLAETQHLLQHAPGTKAPAHGRLLAGPEGDHGQVPDSKSTLLDEGPRAGLALDAWSVEAAASGGGEVHSAASDVAPNVATATPQRQGLVSTENDKRQAASGEQACSPACGETELNSESELSGSTQALGHGDDASARSTGANGATSGAGIAAAVKGADHMRTENYEPSKPLSNRRLGLLSNAVANCVRAAQEFGPRSEELLLVSRDFVRIWCAQGPGLGRLQSVHDAYAGSGLDCDDVLAALAVAKERAEFREKKYNAHIEASEGAQTPEQTLPCST